MKINHNNFLWSNLISSNWIINLATLGPLGYAGKAPGTNGSMAGLIFYIILYLYIKLYWILPLYIILIYLIAKICNKAEILLRKNDSSVIILDEYIAMPIVFLGIYLIKDNYSILIIISIGLFFFRFFDILKPFFINYLQNYKKGWGVVLDDIGAAFIACVCLHVFIFTLDIM